MPRKSRIDTPGALHHIIGRGIDRRRIFLNDADREDFLERLGRILTETKTTCYAWALMPNHFHLLLQTATTPISVVMRRLLTGYAVGFNLRHRRKGHLFQNRYKSILCQEDAYLLQLVRYIHLNPLRANVVAGYGLLGRYPYCGHGVILGRRSESWQDADYVLKMFSEKLIAARRRYGEFVKEGIAQGRRPELVGGGLLRSQGGWKGVDALRRAGAYQKGDERILGDGAFVEQMLAEADDRFERKYRLAAEGFDLERVAARVAELLKMSPDEVFVSTKDRRHAQARSLLCYWSTQELGISQTHLAQRLELTQPAISRAVRRGAELAKERKYSLIGE
jgi:putative transposase